MTLNEVPNRDNMERYTFAAKAGEYMADYEASNTEGHPQPNQKTVNATITVRIERIRVAI